MNQETIASVKNNESETKAIETVKENIDKFTTKTVNLSKSSDGKIYVQSVKWDKWDRLKMSHLFVEIWKNYKSN